jgi:hypothetical protein
MAILLSKDIDRSCCPENLAHLEHDEREGRDIAGVVDGRDEAVELHGGREVAVVVDGGVWRVGLDEEHPLPVAVNLEPPVLIPGEAPRHRVERHERLRQRAPHPLAVEEPLRLRRGPLGATVGVDAGRVDPRHHEVEVGEPQPPPRRLPRRAHDRRPP